MEAAGANLKAETAPRWPRSTLARHASGVERRAVGAGNRSAVAGAAGQVSAVPDLPSTLPAMGAGGQAGTGSTPTRRRTGAARPVAWRRSLCRCHLRGRKKGGLAVGPTRRGKGTKIMAIADAHSLPLAVSIQSASPHESQLVEEVLSQSFLDQLPARLIGDRAYDSDRLDQRLKREYDIELIAPHNPMRRQPTQDGRPLRRYRKRWHIERLFAWLHWFRRLVIRWEYHAENFLGMVRLGCIKLLLRHL